MENQSINKMIHHLEIWKDIDGVEYYQVSSHGRVRSLDRQLIRSNGIPDSKKGRVLRPVDNGKGYLNITLPYGESRKKAYIHRLVAAAFLKRESSDYEVNHIDGVKSNNHVSNLEWCSKSHNMIHRSSIGLFIPRDMSGTNNPNFKHGKRVIGEKERNCPCCKKEFIIKQAGIRFCSKHCSTYYRYNGPK